MTRSAPAALLLLLAMPAVAATTIDPAVRATAEGSFSGDRERGIYEIMRFYDATVRDDRDLVDRAIFAGTSIERAAALRGMCDRTPREPLDRTATDRVMNALDAPDVALRTAAIECLERLPAKAAADLRLEQLADVDGLGMPPVLTRAVLGSLVRNPDPRASESLSRYAARLELKGGSQFTELTPDGAWLVLAMAANGSDVEPLFSDGLKLTAEKDYALKARINRIRAARGDAKALASVIETATVAVDPWLRREAVDLLLTLPAPQRRQVLLALESRLGDVDGPVRARIVRELSRDAVSLDAAGEAMLVKAASDVFPDLRVQALAGLFDRAIAGSLTAPVRAELELAARREKDPLVLAAYRALFAVPAPGPSPKP